MYILTYMYILAEISAYHMQFLMATPTSKKVYHLRRKLPVVILASRVLQLLNLRPNEGRRSMSNKLKDVIFVSKLLRRLLV